MHRLCEVNFTSNYRRLQNSTFNGNKMAPTDYQPGPCQTHFDDLPEELAVAIFSYLSWYDLRMVVATVNKKWNRLSHDNKLWSQMSIKNVRMNDIVNVMHFAPCLRSVCIKNLNLYNITEQKSLQILTQGRCRVRSLCLTDYQPITLHIIRNQLGFLRHLALNCWWNNMRKEYRDDMWKTIFELDLISLRLQEHNGICSYFHTDIRPLPGQLSNLSYLDLDCNQVPGGIVAALLEACKGTLESVALPPKTKGTDVALLSKCLRLREAEVPFVREVTALENNPVLEMVEINAEWLAPEDFHIFVHDVVLFLRLPAVANRLRTLFFQDMPVVCRQLLRATASMRNLRYLRIFNFGEPEEVDAILDVLEHSPKLERLSIGLLPPPAVLDAIKKSFCPLLKELCFIGACSDDNQGCRIPAIKRLLQQRPQLHVFLDEGLGVPYQQFGTYSECVREHGGVWSDDSCWYRVHPVMVNHAPDGCDWCRNKIEDYATVVDMRKKLLSQMGDH